MSDLHTLMTEAAPGLTATSPTEVDADVARGRRSLRVRRARRAFGVSGIAAAAAVGGLTVTSLTGGAGTPAPSVSDADGVTLVAFDGQQPQGFLLDSVPSGWEVQASTLDRVVLAPQGARNHDGSDWVGKLGIQLSLDVSPDLAGSTLRIDGHRAVVKESTGGSASTLFVQQDQGWLVIQAWENLDWDAQRLIEFGEGVTVTDAAEGTAG